MKLLNSYVSSQVLSALVVIYQKFTPPLVEKMKLELCMQDWEQAEDTANRILAVEPKNIEAMRFKILQGCVKERVLGCVSLPLVARGSQEARLTQPKAYFFALPHTACLSERIVRGGRRHAQEALR